MFCALSRPSVRGLCTSLLVFLPAMSDSSSIPCVGLRPSSSAACWVNTVATPPVSISISFGLPESVTGTKGRRSSVGARSTDAISDSGLQSATAGSAERHNTANAETHNNFDDMISPTYLAAPIPGPMRPVTRSETR